MLLFEHHCEILLEILLWIQPWILLTFLFVHINVLNKKVKLTGEAMKPFSKDLLGHENFTFIVLSTLNIFEKIWETNT